MELRCLQSIVFFARGSLRLEWRQNEGGEGEEVPQVAFVGDAVMMHLLLVWG